MKNIYDNWDNLEVFKEQLALNKRQLSSGIEYPPHWHHFLRIVGELQPHSMLDLGCGCGAYYELCRRHFPNLKYSGADFSASAIFVAKESWNYDGFFVKNLFDLTKEGVEDFDLIHLGALLDVLDDGDAGLEHALSLECKSVLVGRMELTYGPSFSRTYKAYNKIETVQFYHNREKVLTIAKNKLYSVRALENTLLFQKNDI